MKIFIANMLVLLLLSVQDTTSQVLMPPIQNYSTGDYAAASQNWDVSLDDRGILYAANNQGLLSYDGQSWELFPLKSKAIIRSVYSHGARIYIGSYQEFGYWIRDDKGEMCYTSLVPLIKNYAFKSEEIWEIVSYKDAIYFRSFGAIYKYSNNEVEVVISGVFGNKMLVYQDRLLLSISREGLFFLNEDNELEALPDQDILKGQVVMDVAVRNENLLIATRQALYEFDGEKCSLYRDKLLNERFENDELNTILVESSSNIIFGTIKNGIIQYNPVTREIKSFNRNNGLRNNTILGIAKYNGKIWVGLDNGIAEINLNSPISYFIDDTGQLGAVYDMAFHKNKWYLASNTGVYVFENDKLQMLEGGQGHSWNLEIIGGKLYSNHNTGTYEILDKNFVPVEKRAGSFQILPVPNEKDISLIATYTGISIISENGEVIEISDIDFPIKQVVFEDESTFWAAHPYQGLYRLKFNKDYSGIDFLQKIDTIQNVKNYNAHVYKIYDQIAILNNERWYKYNVLLDSLEAFKELDAFSDFRLINEDLGNFWFVGRNKNDLIFTDFKTEKLVLSSVNLENRLVINNENIIRFNDSIFYASLNDGFAEININKVRRQQNGRFKAKPIIKGVEDLEKRYSLKTAPEIPYENSRIISFFVGFPDSKAASLNYELHGTDTISGTVSNGKVSFQNLAHGSYSLQFFGQSPHGKYSPYTNFPFRVLPPWYLSSSMQFLYVLLFLGLILLVYWINRLKLKKHRLLLEQKFEQEHQLKLNNLEKERLLDEITLKRKELANTTMIAAKKNEVLMEIQGELNKDKGKFTDQFQLKRIINKINKAIKNEDEWQVFETNFTELHEDFFRTLLKSYPELSNKDLKLCSYIKMNLSSKEIAPLMGISVRGVEVHRYRLRKKMELDSKENLTSFLIKEF
ncbi:helix-turn-helix and ligand-binding sensor domain-containing protein [Gillisia limnaea]|uniref:Regulatory protein LuxR n=1 Tax=Gillisia limnaea (strain DSM 15749 / LMG 21470 / R-8282) TaxID=865937 RepID=H2BVD7_GILLR|nr:LuxR C-terminal-related transcriptional regulator [Gillisia limnaea]EHQ01802.1 regulatory protein LuxR [Gillisia limnaea DSM 15749]